jgi:hypothetical protein
MAASSSSAASSPLVEDVDILRGYQLAEIDPAGGCRVGLHNNLASGLKLAYGGEAFHGFVWDEVRNRKLDCDVL